MKTTHMVVYSHCHGDIGVDTGSYRNMLKKYREILKNHQHLDWVYLTKVIKEG
jgi:hypothetical protein